MNSESQHWYKNTISYKMNNSRSVVIIFPVYTVWKVVYKSKIIELLALGLNAVVSTQIIIWIDTFLYVHVP